MILMLQDKTKKKKTISSFYYHVFTPDPPVQKYKFSFTFATRLLYF